MSGVTWSNSVGPSQKPVAVGVDLDLAAVDDERRARRHAGVEVGGDLVAVRRR